MSRVAVVTGGASGIGRALATALTARGDTVVIADLDAAGAEKVAADLTGRLIEKPSRRPAEEPAEEPAERTTEEPAGQPSRQVRTVRGVALDVRDAGAVAELFGSVKQEHGRLDLVFNNAGIAVGGPAEELTLDHWNKTIDVNLRGVVHGVHAAYPIMLAQGFGHIVNTASLAGLVPAPMMLPYTTAKHGVVGMSLALRAEAAGHGVKVSVICPGFVDTPLLDHVNPGLPQTEIGERTRETITQLRRRLYSPESLARDVLRGIDRDQAVIVAPASARAAWRGMRLSPSLVVRTAARAISRRRHRTA